MHVPVNGEGCPHRECLLFQVLPKEEFAAVAERKRTSVYKAGQVIFHEGNTALGLYCVSSGAVKIAKLGPAGREQTVRLSRPGDLLGYRALFADEPYTGTAVALEDSALCFIPRDVILPLVPRCPDLALAVIRKLSQDLKAAEAWVRDMALKNARQRLAEAILTLQLTYGVPDGGGVRLSLPLSRQELAEMAGLATETAIRLLKEFRSKGILLIHGREVTVRDPQALLKASGMKGLARLAKNDKT